MEKVCECCGKNFKTYKNKQKYCSKTCGQCNKRQVKIVKECEFSGCTNTFEILLKSNRRFCSVECQCFWQRTSQLGENNGNYGKENKWGKHDEKMRLLISDKIKKSWLDDGRVIKHNEARERFKLINGYYPNNSPKAREKRSEQNVKRYLETGHLNTYKNCKRGYYINNKNGALEYFHSSWEEILMKELDANEKVLNWTKKHNIIIRYKHDGILKSYIPDFFIEYSDGKKIIEEVKGYIDDVDVFKLKKEACEKYCYENNIEYRINFMKNYNKYKHLL
jgi:hypothetical protein